MGTQTVKKHELRPVEAVGPMALLDEMERWAEEFLPRGWIRPFHGERFFMGESLPRVDLIDRENDVLVRAAIPGFSKDDIEVSLTDSTVTIRGSAKGEEEKEKGEYYRHEIRTEDFVRTLTLPVEVDSAKADALFKEGVLEITLPKREKSKRHTVRIH